MIDLYEFMYIKMLNLWLMAYVQLSKNVKMLKYKLMELTKECNELNW